MTDHIEDPSLDDDFEPSEETSDAVKERGSGVGFKTVLICSALASIIGIFGGGFLAKTMITPTENFVAEVTQTDMDAMTSALDALKSRTAKLEAEQAEILKIQDARKLSASDSDAPSTDAPDMAEFSAELLPLFEDIESRLNALESGAIASKVDPVETLEDANKSETVEGAKNTSKASDPIAEPLDIADNSKEISVLTDSITDMETRITAQSKRYVSKSDLQALKKRVAKLEADFEKPPVLIPPFPREAVMDVLTGKTDEEGGWLSGLLGDEVRVVDAETVMRLDRIEKFVEAGDINAIKKELVYLPADAKPVIDDWLAQFEQSE